jgi:uncharacterized damage-inducible protein DinB
MSSLTPEQATFIVHVVGLTALRAEHPLTTAVIGAIPAEKADYRPDSVAKTALDLAWHIVTAEIRFLDGVASAAFDFSGTSRPPSITTPVDIVDWYSSRFATSMERLRQVSGNDLLKPIDFRGLFQMPALGYVQLAINHSIHHRGQLSMYLRPMGAKVPSIYGESYDARQARERAQPA